MINCSTSFVFRARCKFCSGKPKHYFLTIDKFIPNTIKKWLNTKRQHIQSDKDPLNKKSYAVKYNYPNSIYLEINNFSNSFNNIDLKYWKNLVNSSNYGIKEFLACECRRTLWAHVDFVNKNSGPLSNHRCKYEAPR